MHMLCMAAFEHIFFLNPIVKARREPTYVLTHGLASRTITLTLGDLDHSK